MNLNKQTKLLLGVLGVIIALMYFYNLNPIKNAGSLSYEENPLNDYRDSVNDFEAIDGTETPLESKFRTKNTADAQYKKFSYSEGDRNSTDVDTFFDRNNQLITDAQIGSGTGVNDEFVGNDNAGSQSLAAYKSSGKSRIPSDEEIFRSEDYLAQELNKDWFEVMPEPISVKNRHLINVTRPVGVNTTGNTLRNASYDVRGAISIAKAVVSPWNQSSIENDINNKGLCN